MEQMKYLVIFTWPSACNMHKNYYTLEECEMFCDMFQMKMVVNYSDKTITIS